MLCKFLRSDVSATIDGTGRYGDLPVTDKAKEILAKYETVIQPTPEVLELMEKVYRPYVAILHTTC
ncbi:MAG: hypothetical protein WAK75_03995 [Methanoregula sp.]|uniref:hypothetical protein n=1 Tax=Methanoregula sp. TaxID=2052170 RepID=UPI003BB0230D